MHKVVFCRPVIRPIPDCVVYGQAEEQTAVDRNHSSWLKSTQNEHKKLQTERTKNQNVISKHKYYKIHI